MGALRQLCRKRLAAIEDGVVATRSAEGGSAIEFALIRAAKGELRLVNCAQAKGVVFADLLHEVSANFGIKRPHDQ